MMLEVGKLYSCSKYFLLLINANDARRTHHVRLTAEDCGLAVSYWIRELGNPVSFCEPLTPLLVLSMTKKKTYIEVLVGDKRGWFVNDGWLEFKEIVEDYED